ncbi:MAG: hypothetical protein AAB781_01495 [Patescibacteria group bacterium]
MSAITQRKCLEGMKNASAAYVVGHARWRQSRGKKPSLSFEGEFNPKIALEMAIAEFEKFVDDSNFWLKNLRGDNLTSASLELFKKFALKSGRPLSYFQTSEEELEKISKKFKN